MLLIQLNALIKTKFKITLKIDKAKLPLNCLLILLLQKLLISFLKPCVNTLLIKIYSFITTISKFNN